MIAQLFFVYLGTVVAILAKLILAVLLCAALDYLCSSGREEWAWFVVISLVDKLKFVFIPYA